LDAAKPQLRRIFDRRRTLLSRRDSGRDDDALGLGVAYIHISDKVAAAVSAANQHDHTDNSEPDFEATIELVYRCKLRRGSPSNRTRSMSSSPAVPMTSITR
jgi:hypothetical protein